MIFDANWPINKVTLLAKRLSLKREPFTHLFCHKDKGYSFHKLINVNSSHCIAAFVACISATSMHIKSNKRASIWAQGYSDAAIKDRGSDARSSLKLTSCATRFSAEKEGGFDEDFTLH